MYKGNPDNVRFSQSEIKWFIDEMWNRHMWSMESFTDEEGGRWIDSLALRSLNLIGSIEYIHSVRFWTPGDNIIEFDEINGIRPWIRPIFEVFRYPDGRDEGTILSLRGIDDVPHS